MSDFKTGWYVYPHARVAVIVFNEQELVEQEAVMGEGQYIRDATEGEIMYQGSGIPAMVANFHSIMNQSIRIDGKNNTGVAS